MQKQINAFVVATIVCFSNFVSLAQMSDEAVYQKALNAVFTIKTDNGQGTGFVFGDGQTVVTNYHVIKGATEAVAVPSGNMHVEYQITGVIAADVELDVAVLKIKGTYRIPLPAATYTPRIAQKVFALGSPQGLDATFTNGMVSAMRDGYIQHTAPISPGSSGEPLLNANCEVVGMNTMQLAEGQNLNFAVPVSTILDVMKNEHKLVSIADINEIHGSAEEKDDKDDDDDKDEADVKPMYHMTFSNGQTLHEAILVGIEGELKMFVRFRDQYAPGGYDVIQQTCDVQLSEATSTNKWAKMPCQNAVSLKKAGKTNYLSDTFWINKETNKVMLSDGQRDSKGNLRFVDVTAQPLTIEMLAQFLRYVK